MKYLFIYIAVFATVFAQDDNEIPNETETEPPGPPVIFLSDDASEFTWSPKSDGSIVVVADEGYKISVNVTDCNIDGENKEYASITADQLIGGLTFTYTVSNNPSYVYNSNRLLGNFVGTDASNFTVIFIRIGELLTTTTTEIPTTTIYLPTPAENISSTLQVYLKGKSPADFDYDAVQLLTDAITAMAIEYCNNENFPLNGSITASNVLIKKLIHCPLNWPDTDICTDLTFAVPVNLIEDTNSLWSGYQMTTEHLRLMWSRYKDSYLPDGITTYSTDSHSLKWAIVISSVIVGAFVIAMIAIRYFSTKMTSKPRRSSDTASIVSTSDRDSQTSLPPHYYQERPLPPEYQYPMHNPEPYDYEVFQDPGIEVHQPSEDNNIVSRA